MESNYLTFELLDDILDLSATQRNRILCEKKLLRIGPFLELAYQNYINIDQFLLPFSSSMIYQQLLTSYRSTFTTTPNTTSLTPKNLEFLRLPRNDVEADQAKWEAFLNRVKNAAESIGLEKALSSALAAIMGEMVENVILHSENSKTGIGGYQIREREFEFVIADAGIGIMDSLRKNKKYSYISDSAQALKTAIENGATRFQEGTGHGTGFNLLLNIAKKDSYIRFRTGNHSLVLDGTKTNKTGYVNKEAYECSSFNGFLVSFVCQLPST